MSSSLIRTSHDLGAECPDPYIPGYLSSFSVFRRPLSPYSMSHQLAYTVPCLSLPFFLSLLAFVLSTLAHTLSLYMMEIS